MAELRWSLENGRTLDHFRILAPLGAGGTGEVYLAEEAIHLKSLAYVNVEPLAEVFLRVPGVPDLFRRHDLLR